MSSSAALSSGVVEEVCTNLNVKEVPGSLLCNIHALMMFGRSKVDDDVWKIGRSKSFVKNCMTALVEKN